MKPLRFLAPAGTRIRGRDLLRWFARLTSGEKGANRFAEAFRQRYGIDSLHLLSSGRAAMTMALSSLRGVQPEERNEVVIPGYTCYSVAASAILAGYRVRPCEVDLETLSYDRTALEQVDFSRVAALISANLYGIPDELPYLESLCRDTDTIMIDDAAQAMHARVGTRFVGTFGDLGIFSLDKGKNITSIQGGIIAINQPRMERAITETLSSLPQPGTGRQLRDAIKLLAYAVLLPPRLYWMPQRALSLGGTPFELDYPITRYSQALGAMADILFQRIDDLTGDRQRVAEALLAGLAGSEWRSPGLEGTEAVYPRLPVLAPDHTHRESALSRLNDAGIGASASYPQPIIDVPEVQQHLARNCPDTPTARFISRTLVTLPTHGFVTRNDIDRMLALLQSA